MPNLPPLPLVDGALLIDNSFVEGFTTCPRSNEYSRLRHRASAYEKPALSFGTAVHEVMAYLSRTHNDHYKANDPEVDRIITDYFAAHPAPDGDHRSADFCRELISQYVSEYEVEPWSVLQSEKGPLVEMPFVTKLYDAECKLDQSGTEPWKLPIYWMGKIDLAVKHKSRIWTVDHKTTSMLGQNFQYEQEMSAQHPGYCWSFWKLTGELPAGFIVNALRTNKMTDKCRAADKKAQNKWWKEGFARYENYVTETTLLEWETNVKSLVDEFLWHHARDYMPRKQKWCVGKYGICQFYNVCSLPDPPQRLMMLDSNAFIDDHWSPLNQPQQETSKTV